jgi:predicted amidophosphoribosyltransferase
MLLFQKLKQIKQSKQLCKQCRKEPRHSLYFCKDCLLKHNKRTRTLKQRYRKNKLCVMCGIPTDGKRRCFNCEEKNKEYVKGSLFILENKIKRRNKIKDILKLF